jgi:DNA-binding LacI/PurR family transcriptional regulator
VDGIILTRNLINDISVSYLKHKAIPFVLLGSCEDDSILQIDYNHMEACEMLISHLLMDGFRRIALIAGDRNHRVNRYRCEGYYNALRRHGIALEQDMVYFDCSSRVFIEQALHSCLKRQAECIVCTDDVISGKVVALLREEGYVIPDNIKVASFYDSIFLEMQNPPITAIGFSAQELGTVAGKRLIGLLNGDESKFKTILDYEIHLRRSTKM